MVEAEYSIHFRSTPPSHPPSPSLFRDPSHKQLLIQEVQALLALGAVEEVPQEFRGKGFYSRYFLVPKAKGGLRPILDLRNLNKYIVNLKFCMVSLATIIPSLDPGHWYAALDMKDAYFHISIALPHRRFLRFVVHKTHYQFIALPFGLCTAPRVFTKCMAVVAAFLCRHHIHVFPYLDDWLIRGRSRQQVQAHMRMVTDTFNCLGIMLNVSKSVLLPTQSIEFIGAVLDANKAQAFLPEARRLALVDIITNLRMFPTTTARQCFKLLGHMASCTYVVQHARLCLRPLQAWLASVYRPGRDSLDMVLTVPNPMLDSLRWWLNPWMVGAGVPFQSPQPTLTLVTDASALGWGAHLGHLTMQGMWQHHEITLHVNIKELRAIHLACQAFLPRLRDHCVEVLTDNTTAMFYLNKQGGARSSPLSQEALLLWELCLAHSISLQASYLPGVQNVLADSLRRRMVNSPGHHSFYFPCLGVSPSRPVRLADQQEMPSLLLLQGSQPELDRGRLPDPMVRPAALHIPAFPADPQGAPQSPQGQGGWHLTGPCLGLSVLVPNPVGPLNTVTHTSPAQSQPHFTGPRLSPPSGPSVAPPNGLEDSWLNRAELACSASVRRVFLESRKPSTRLTFEAKWKRFSIWCAQRQVLPLQATVPCILDYLMHLKEEHLAFGSLKVYLAAISAFHPGADGRSVFAHSVVQRFIKGLEKVHPPTKTPVPAWDLNLVLSCLMGPPFEPLASCSLLYLSWKVAFLVAITSARQVSELRALMCNPPYTICHKDKVQLRPHPSFLPKVVSHFHVSQDIFLPVFFPKLYANPPGAAFTFLRY
ncbi:uncharacterized protein RBU57_000616 [Macrochelys suwanniensis]